MARPVEVLSGVLVSVRTVAKQKALFYDLPAKYLQPGVSTDDGQDVIAVQHEEPMPHGLQDPRYLGEGTVSYTCYTPRPDDPDQDAENMMYTDIRIARKSELVELAVFADTDVDLSKHPKAVLR